MSKMDKDSTNKGKQNISQTVQKTPYHKYKAYPQKLVSKFALSAFLILTVCTIVLVAHWPAINAKTISFDDHNYLLENQAVQNPSWTSTVKFLTEILEPSTVEGYYQPLTMISLMVDCALGGRPNNLRPFHITSLLLHIFNTILVIVLLYLLFGQLLAATAVGLLFGVHPLTVESIPWVGERKTLLATFLVLWSLIFYLYYLKRNWRKFYLASLATFVLALMSKPSSIPLPFLMLLLDYWPLNRLNKKAFTEKVPFFIICVVFGVVIFISQSRTFGAHMPGEYGLKHVILTICHNIVLYLSNMAWPTGLSLFYPFPKPMDLSHPQVLSGIIGTVVLITVLIISLCWTRALLAGWLFFFVAVFPTMGVIKFHDMIAADRHVYLPSIGMLLILAYYLGRLFDKLLNTKAHKAVTIAFIAILAVLETSLSRQYYVYWKDTEIHHRRMLELAPNEPVIRNYLGLELFYKGKYTEAFIHFKQALKLRPNDAETYNNLASVLLVQNKLDEAVKHYQKALQINSDLAHSHYNLANIFKLQGKLKQAAYHYRKTLQLNPGDIEAQNKLNMIQQSQDELNDPTDR